MTRWIHSHRIMLSDKVRVEAYRKAIFEVIKPGDVVVDIGTGSGILAFFAIQAGAKKVYAIEKGKIAIEAQKLVDANNLVDKIEVINDQSDKVDLPEKVDVLISELLGVFALEENLHKYKLDAKSRFLKPGGRMIPSSLELCVLPVQSEELRQRHIAMWNEDFYGVDYTLVQEYAFSQRYNEDCSGVIIPLAAPCSIASINYTRVDEINLVYKGQVEITKPGLFHGLVGYFETTLSPGVVLSTSPDEPATHWKQSFFHTREVTEVQPGDICIIILKAIPQRDDVYWDWTVSIERNGEQIVSSRSSNFTVPLDELQVGRGDFIPVLNEKASKKHIILELCDGKRTVNEIASLLMEQYPGEYPDLKTATQKVTTAIRGKVILD